jgi:hypothetical protein
VAVILIVSLSGRRRKAYHSVGRETGATRYAAGEPFVAAVSWISADLDDALFRGGNFNGAPSLIN